MNQMNEIEMNQFELNTFMTTFTTLNSIEGDELPASFFANELARRFIQNNLNDRVDEIGNSLRMQENKHPSQMPMKITLSNEAFDEIQAIIDVKRQAEFETFMNRIDEHLAHMNTTTQGA
jgi:hypothetical protein